MPIERRGDDASRNVSLGFPLLGAVVSRETGSTRGANEPSRHTRPPAYPARNGPRRLTAELADDVAIVPSGVTLLHSGGCVDDRDAAARAMASCGVARDDGIWITECAWCTRVRNVSGDWVVINATTRAGMHGERTHGICAQCSEACIARASAPSAR